MWKASNAYMLVHYSISIQREASGVYLILQSCTSNAGEGKMIFFTLICRNSVPKEGSVKYLDCIIHVKKAFSV